MARPGMDECAYKKVEASIITRLKELVSPAHVFSGPEMLVAYSYDATKHEALPEVVVRATATEEVAAVLTLANQERIPVYPRGAGSGMTGGALPLSGGLVLDLTLMKRILDINEHNLTAEVEPGVVVFHLQEAVEKRGLFYPPDPASNKFATLGGTVAECAGGLRGLKYGVTRDYVLALETVLADGSIIHTGRGTLKSVTGYDVTRFLIGSEGTLGVFTRITVRLVPLPHALLTMVLVFASVQQSAEFISEVARAKIIPRALEFVDTATFARIREHKDFGFPQDAGALVLAELDGHESGVLQDKECLRILAQRVGALEVREAVNSRERERLWDMRRAASSALLAESPRRINEDICVPRDKLAEMLSFLEKMSKDYDIPVANFGHAGDGNIHVNILVNEREPEQFTRAHRMVEEIFRQTVALGGTLSGEHGIGITKSEFLRMEVGERELKLMRDLKRLFDPKGILNPGKIFPTRGMTSPHFRTRPS